MLLSVKSNLSWGIQFSHIMTIWSQLQYDEQTIPNWWNIFILMLIPELISECNLYTIPKLVLSFWLRFGSFFFSPSFLQGALFNDVYQGFINYYVLLSLGSPCLGSLWHVVSVDPSVEILGTLELFAKSPCLWAYFHPLSPLSVVSEK
jgi:hypothetical protein